MAYTHVQYTKWKLDIWRFHRTLNCEKWSWFEHVMTPQKDEWFWLCARFQSRREEKKRRREGGGSQQEWYFKAPCIIIIMDNSSVRYEQSESLRLYGLWCNVLLHPLPLCPCAIIALGITARDKGSLKGNGMRHGDWLHYCNAQTTPMHNLAGIGGV